MPRPRNAAPNTIFTCISEPDEGGSDMDAVIRYSADPEALDSLPTHNDPAPEIVSKSRVAYDYLDSFLRRKRNLGLGAAPAGLGSFHDLSRSCRGATGPHPDGFEFMAGETLRPNELSSKEDNLDFAINWLLGTDPKDFKL